MALTPQQKLAMARGRERKRREDDRVAVRRVLAYTRWLQSGSVLSKIPEIPTDRDYAIARRRRAAGR